MHVCSRYTHTEHDSLVSLCFINLVCLCYKTSYVTYRTVYPGLLRCKKNKKTELKCAPGKYIAVCKIDLFLDNYIINAII